MAALVVVSIATSPPILDAFAENATVPSWVGMLLSTGAVAVLLGRWSVRAREAHGAVARVVAGGFLAGWLNSVLGFIAWASCSPGLFPNPFGALVAAPLVAIPGLVIGGPIGVGYGVLFIAPILLAHAHARLPTPDTADRCLFGTGVWGALVVFGAGMASIVLADPLRPRTQQTPSPLAVVLLVVAATVAVALAGFAGVRLLRRRAWFARVRRGQVPGWVVVPLEAVSCEELDGIPRLSGRFPTAVLAQVSYGEGYREAPRRIRPWALVSERYG